MEQDYEAMRRLAADIRIGIVKELLQAGFGHVGGAASIADVLGVLYGGVMRVRPEDPKWEHRDYLVVSKGHAGPALYAALAQRGYFDKDWLLTLNKPRTHLPSHCDMRRTPGVDMTTGSLGQGISCAVGIALGNRLQNRDNYTYCIIGDGEANEGAGLGGGAERGPPGAGQVHPVCGLEQKTAGRPPGEDLQSS